MSPKDLFLAALDQPADERAAFLATLDPEVRQRVEQLLAAHAAANDFLNPSLGPPQPTLESVAGGSDLAATARLGAGPLAGLVIAGRYTLEKRLGEGGMGEVWVAQQSEPVSRRVALKLMKPGMDSRAFLARFEAERQALALMDHPSIARVLDGGLTPDHRPYYVMELVQGHSLTDYCDHAKLTPRQRLELFIPICQAVQHAHQKGIVHRDLKPNNILVTTIDGRPVPKVIDFGVAKATGGKLTDESVHTDFGVIVGTLEYMSPEQAGQSGHDIDTRADIYSLGVILYELLTGLRPIDAKRLRKAALTEMVRIIREEEPSKPSTRLSTAEGLPSLAALRQTEPRKLMALLRGDLDWVVMKCLEKDRGRRYETANGLARDIQRYLADEAVEARPPSLGYRAGKFLKRHRGPVAAAALVLLALVAGIIGTTWGLIDAQKARAAEANRAEGERQAKLEAQKRLKQVEAGIGILFSIFDDLDLKKIKRGTEPLDAVLAKRLVGAARQLEGESIGDPLLVANLQDKLGNTLIGLGYAPEAATLFQKSRDTRTKLQGPDRLETLVSMHNLAEAYRLAGRLQEAVALYGETVRRMSATVGDNHPVTLRTLGGQATALHDAGNLEAALPLREALLKRLQAAPGEYESEILINLASLADAYLGAGKYGQSLPMYEEAIRRMEAHLGADHPETLQAMHNYGGALLRTGQPNQALPYMEKIYHRRRAKLGDEHPDTLASLANLAEGLQAASKAEEAVPLLRKAYEQMKTKMGEDHPYTLTIMSNLASSYQRAGKMDPALTLWESCVRKMKLTKGDTHPDTLTVMNNLASGYQAAGKTLQALPLLEEAYQRKKEKLGPEHPLTLGGMNLLAEGHLRAGRPQQGLPLFKDCLRLRREKLGPDHPDTLISMNNLGLCHRDLGRNDLALPLFKDALKGMKEKLGPEHYDTLTCMNNLALAYHGTGRLDLAMPLYEQALEIRERKFGPNHPDTLQSLGNLAAACWMAKQGPKALRLFEETLRRYEATLGRKHPHTLRIVGNLGILYKDSGRLEDALPLLEEVHQAATQHPFLSFASTALLDGYLKLKMTDQARELTQSLAADARKKLPANSADLGNSLAVYGMAFMELGAFAEAEPVLRDCLAIRDKIQPEAWQRFSTMSVLGGALLGQKKYADAEPLLLQGYQGLKEREKTVPVEARALRLREALQRLVDFYTATGKPEEAAKWRKELDALPTAATSETSPERK